MVGPARHAVTNVKADGVGSAPRNLCEIIATRCPISRRFASSVFRVRHSPDDKTGSCDEQETGTTHLFIQRPEGTRLNHPSGEMLSHFTIFVLSHCFVAGPISALRSRSCHPLRRFGTHPSNREHIHTLTFTLTFTHAKHGGPGGVRTHDQGIMSPLL